MKKFDFEKNYELREGSNSMITLNLIYFANFELKKIVATLVQLATGGVRRVVHLGVRVQHVLVELVYKQSGTGDHTRRHEITCCC